ncbi:hypothetical protein H0E87_022811 [Populus deltoides]|uniref:Uncharacterized protein n=1 Tax=Populus deltoides TaxID=3696 RepID=A0A8T2XBM3_POPDE|nr:hypothetical protein H0E87_022811 [Populus deltoides]
MTDRFFPNVMPSFVTEDIQEEDKVTDEDSLMKLLSMPYTSLSKQFQRSGLDLKETIVMETWGLGGQVVHDFTLYSGNLGTALLLYKSYQVTGNENDLFLCLEIVKACDSASRASRDVTFICGRAGVCALGAVAAKHANDEASQSIMNVLLDVELRPDEFEDVKGTLKYMINNCFPSGNYSTSEEDRKRDVLVHWCHGAPGIALTLVKAVKVGALCPSGNYFAAALYKIEMCNAQVFGDKEFLEAAINAAEVVWNRGLLKRVGICHGISGNAYVFLSLYQLTGNIEFLYKAKAFTCFLLDRAHKLIPAGEMHGGDSPYSMFEGMGGMAYLFLDMIDPSKARFPAYEL